MLRKILRNLRRPIRKTHGRSPRNDRVRLPRSEASAAKHDRIGNTIRNTPNELAELRTHNAAEWREDKPNLENDVFVISTYKGFKASAPASKM